MGEIADPGVYDDVPFPEYLADPVPGGSISASGIRDLLPPSCPAKFRWQADHPGERKSTDAQDFGSVAHALVLGTPEVFIPIEALNKRGEPVTDYKTVAAQDEAKAIRAAGCVPVLKHVADRAQEVADAVLDHPVAGELFAEDEGIAEATLVWQDPEFGVWCRARPDRLPPVRPGQRMVIPDLKTTSKTAHPDACDYAIVDHGYHRQGHFYRAGAIELGLDPDPAFVVVFVETTPPYLITIRQLRELDDYGRPGPLAVAGWQVRKGLSVFAECQQTGEWPDYTDPDRPIDFAELPRRTLFDEQRAWNRGDYDTPER